LLLENTCKAILHGIVENTTSSKIHLINNSMCPINQYVMIQNIAMVIKFLLLVEFVILYIIYK
jgi:hypothetical protein